MPTLRVDVTEEDIREGTPSDTQRCAVARAFERASGFECEVDGACLYLGEGMPPLALPESARDFQARYDGPGGRWQVLPFAFEVDVPDVSARA
jgi:hypothetical protein